MEAEREGDLEQTCAVQDRRSSGYRRRSSEHRAGLERRRGPGRRRADHRRAAEEGEITDEVLEFVMAIDPKYACCTFLGSLVSLDAASGETVWKSFTIDAEPVEVARTRVGTAILAPSGAPIWNSPTVDEKRGRLYLGTGENYSSPAGATSIRPASSDSG